MNVLFSLFVCLANICTKLLMHLCLCYAIDIYQAAIWITQHVLQLILKFYEKSDI